MELDLGKSLIENIKKIANENLIDKIVLFGSRARGDNRKNSDIDLAVYCSKESKDESKIYFEFEDIETLFKLDIIFIKESTDKKLIENIQREGVVLYEREQQ
ncbi:nucleotidyltransferase domain-containing protein [Clostridium oryzae]|uniref:Nucleotidyltransferase domain protein n=1 Tax=Clostridium oryzae TaxID=1450648 RepID=A0A1V4IVL7_9CLOT|nr:nucleotidyltransferase domain-containing protein [Clostridium oryzae]OPJ63939.1 nucleotidyltransferase domain protein [Clostridium oryzae]